jgi:hypothetical protein
MPQYSGSVLTITPSTTDDNWTITAGTGIYVKVKEVSMGGQATTSTAMSTRIARSSGQTGSSSAGNTEKLHPGHATKRAGFVLTFATTQPTLEAGDLFAPAWNAHGGSIRYLAAPGDEFVLVGAATELCISCRNSVGTATSNYGVIWMEE